MPRGDEANCDLTEPDRLAIGHWIGALMPIAHVHDRQRFGRRPHRAVTAARMIGVPMRHQRAFLGLRGIDPRVGGFDIYAFGKRLDPITEARHIATATETMRGSRSIIERVLMEQEGLWGIATVVGPIVLLLIPGHAPRLPRILI